MSKLVVVLFAITIASVACQSLPDEENSDLKNARTKCENSIDNALNELDVWYDTKKNDDESSSDLDFVKILHRNREAHLETLRSYANKVEVMVVDHELKTPNGEKINCSEDIAKEVVRALTFDSDLNKINMRKELEMDSKFYRFENNSNE